MNKSASVEYCRGRSPGADAPFGLPLFALAANCFFVGSGFSFATVCTRLHELARGNQSRRRLEIVCSPFKTCAGLAQLHGCVPGISFSLRL
jgi:hypothetical protein